MTSLRKGLKLEAGGVVSLAGAGGKTSLMFKLAREISAAGEPVLTTTTTKIFRPTPDQSPGLIISDSTETLLRKAEDLFKDHHCLHVTAAAGTLMGENKLVGFRPETIDSISKANLFRWIIVEADGAAGKPLKAPNPYEPVFPDCTGWVIGLVGLSAVGKPLTEHWVFRPERFMYISGLTQGAGITESAIGNVLGHKNGIFKGAPANALRIAFLNQADVPGALAAGRKIVHLLIGEKKSTINRIVIGQILVEPPILECYETGV
jgi:probable selenium-dependent hydroxylase accessory protein YqeC